MAEWFQKGLPINLHFHLQGRNGFIGAYRKGHRAVKD